MNRGRYSWILTFIGSSDFPHPFSAGGLWCIDCSALINHAAAQINLAGTPSHTSPFFDADSFIQFLVSDLAIHQTLTLELLVCFTG
ncbi:hypothetical protein I7I48_11257 [Histoplasma ohiense]|nr:hypothetical protein I7I48_11257 [Histoplasma ohiense (nom. inval.)]